MASSRGTSAEEGVLLLQMEGGWPDDSIGRASDGGALCDGHASLHTQPRTESKVDVRSSRHLTLIRSHMCATPWSGVAPVDARLPRACAEGVLHVMHRKHDCAVVRRYSLRATLLLMSAMRPETLLCSRVSCSTQHLLDAVTSDAFGSELPVGIISLDGASMTLSCIPAAWLCRPSLISVACNTPERFLLNVRPSAV